MKQPPRYFCDNCGTEVFSDDRACPYCGRLFVSVRCPKCGYSGEDKRFENGCPLCGYSDPNAGKKKNEKVKKKKPKRQHRHHEPLPFWGYIVMFIALFILILLFSHLITL